VVNKSKKKTTDQYIKAAELLGEKKDFWSGIHGQRD
jgi:hypothetical protein